MNSVIEAQQEFTECFGEDITLHQLFKGLTLPLWSNESAYLEKFLDDHRTVNPAQTIPPIKVNVRVTYDNNHTTYKFL